jgi:midasin
LEAYVNLARSHIMHSAFWHRALLKFSYIISQTALTLAKEGFCKPTETDESEGADISGLEGTGMGSGEGANNVSDQITGDEQLEGLQDEKEDESAPKDATDDKDDNVFDMDDDFGGTTEDAGGREDNDDSSDKDDEQDEGDLDEELGDVDPLDPSAMDEKFWDEDQKEEDESSAPQEEQSNQNAGQPDSTDMGERTGGAEEADEEDKKSEELEDKKPEDGIDENANAGEQLPDGSSDEPQEDDEPAEDGQRQELPDIDLDNETLDLPDDLQLDTPRDADDGDIDDEDAQEEGGGGECDIACICILLNADVLTLSGR